MNKHFHIITTFGTNAAYAHYTYISWYAIYLSTNKKKKRKDANMPASMRGKSPREKLHADIHLNKICWAEITIIKQYLERKKGF